MRHALIENGIVVNIIRLRADETNDFPNAVPTGGYPVQIGDSYDGLYFYCNGAQLKTNAEMQLEEREDMKAALANLGVNVDE